MSLLLHKRLAGKLDTVVKVIYSGKIELGWFEPSKTLEVRVKFTWDPKKTRITDSYVYYTVEFLCYPPGCIPTGDSFIVYFNGAEVAKETWIGTGGTRRNSVRTPMPVNGENVFHLRVERFLGITPLTWTVYAEWKIVYEGVQPPEPTTPEEELLKSLWLIAVITSLTVVGSTVIMVKVKKRK